MSDLYFMSQTTICNLIVLAAGSLYYFHSAVTDIQWIPPNVDGS